MTFTDGMPLKGVRPEHLIDDIIVPSHLNPSVYGTVGDITAIDPDDAAAAGSTGRLADAGHSHEFITAAPSALTKTSSNSEGSSGDGARADHGHSTSALPWGVIGRFASTSNDSSRAAGVDTDMTVTASLLSTRQYFVTLYGELNVGTAGVTIAVELEHDGTVVGRFFRVGPSTNVGGNGPFMIHSTIPYVPAIDDASATLTVSNASGSGGSITIHPHPGAPGTRSLVVTDQGPI